MYLDDRLIKKVFKHHKQDSLNLLRLYYIANTHFYNKSGVFNIDQLCDILAVRYGHKSLLKNRGGNKSKYKKTLVKIFRSCPLLFIESKDNIFRCISKRRIHKKRNKKRNINPDLLHKKNKRELYDLFIGSISDGLTVDYKTLSDCTGLTQARVCQASRGNHQKRHIYKINNEIIIKSFQNKYLANQYRLWLYKKRLEYNEVKVLTHIVSKDKKFHVVQYGANSYTSTKGYRRKCMLRNNNGILQPIPKQAYVNGYYLEAPIDLPDLSIHRKNFVEMPLLNPKHRSNTFSIVDKFYKPYKNLCKVNKNMRELYAI